jgi:hypothetical protein
MLQMGNSIHSRRLPRTRDQRKIFWLTGIGIAVVLMGFLTSGGARWVWTKYSTHHAAVTPLLTLLAGVAVAGVALIRHFAQTDADRQRRITETFSKAIEQLGSDKIEVRLGGVYSLERISKESPDDYWTIMENVAGFIRERSCRMEGERTSSAFDERVSRRAYFLWLEAGRPEGFEDLIWAHAVEQEKFGEPPPTDIAAALTVVMRRDERSRKRETEYHWRLDFTGAILRKANLDIAHLEGANFDRARLEGASLSHAHLEGAYLVEAHLEGANLSEAHLEGANLVGAHLEGANLVGAHLEGANLSEAIDVSEAHLVQAHGDSSTKLPEWEENALLRHIGSHKLKSHNRPICKITGRHRSG